MARLNDLPEPMRSHIANLPCPSYEKHPFCTRAVGALAHYFESAGIPATQIRLIREHTEVIKPLESPEGLAILWYCTAVPVPLRSMRFL
jgi:hypothetical protein